jgi:transposase
LLSLRSPGHPAPRANRVINNQGQGTLFDRTLFIYDEKTDTFRCPGQCTNAPYRVVNRHLHEGALQHMNQRATAQALRLRRSTVEHPFGTLKYRIFGHPRFLMRGIAGAQAEMSLATIAYNLKRMMNVLGGQKLAAALAG